MIRVLVALEMRTYREAIAGALQFARPQSFVSISDPEVLDSEMNSLEPHVVICSKSTSALRAAVLCWVKMRIVGEDLRTVVSIEGQARLVPNITLTELVSVVDEVEALSQG